MQNHDTIRRRPRNNEGLEAPEYDLAAARARGMSIEQVSTYNLIEGTVRVWDQDHRIQAATCQLCRRTVATHYLMRNQSSSWGYTYRCLPCQARVMARYREHRRAA